MLYDIVREWRGAREGLRRYLITPETSKHRIFTFVDASVAASHSLICVGLEDAFALGVLSSTVHTTWALAAGSRLGIDATPRYNKSSCFEPFPFPDPPDELRQKIAATAEQIHSHRNAALARSAKVGVTIMYNVVEKLRNGAELTKAEREAHKVAACGTLRDLHDELDQLVAEAYGWPWPEPSSQILDRLVALHDRRIQEESAGTVRWLRPECQRPRYAKDVDAATVTDEEARVGRAVESPASPWPTDAIGQITALRALVLAKPISVDEATSRFTNARRDLVARHLETLAILGEVLALGGDQYAAAAPAC